jgi:hypothetical protein
VNHDPSDGGEEDSFSETSLHISYTDWQLPIDIGARGKRDVEAHYVEAAIGVYDRGKWVADLNILDVFRHRLSQIVRTWTDHRKYPPPIDETAKFVTIDNWEELLDSPTEVGVVHARGNWQARLAAAALSIQRGHETVLLSERLPVQTKATMTMLTRTTTCLQLCPGYQMMMTLIARLKRWLTLQ